MSAEVALTVDEFTIRLRGAVPCGSSHVPRLQQFAERERDVILLVALQLSVGDHTPIGVEQVKTEQRAVIGPGERRMHLEIDSLHTRYERRPTGNLKQNRTRPAGDN